MADFRIALGGTISAATTDEMHTALGELKSDLMAGSRTPQPIYRPLSKAVTVGSMTSGQNVILPIGSPQPGRIWRVTRITVVGADDTTALTNVSAAVYIGDPMNPSLTQCVQHGEAIPFTTVENDKAFPVHSRESLFINIVATGSASSVSVVANAIAWEYSDDAVSQMVI